MGVAADVHNTIGELKTLTLSAAVFGENQDIQRQIMTAYENKGHHTAQSL